MKTKTPNNKKCKGGIYITSAKEWEEFIAKYNHFGGSLDVRGTGLTSLTFPSCMSIGGYLYVRGTGLTSLTFPSGMSIGGYQLNDVEFDKKLFMKVFYGQLSAKEIG